MSTKLALLGVWHVHAIHHLQDARANPDADVVVVWDRDPVAGQAFATANALPFEPDLATILARPDIEAVIVDTATLDHGAVIGAALAAGKHVFTEKVLAATTAEATDLVRAARTYGRVLRVSMQRLVEAPILTAKALIEEGAIGTLTSSRIRYAHGGAVGGRPSLSPDFLDPAQAGGGAIIDLGAHGFYLGLLFHAAEPLAIRTTMSSVTGLAVEDNTVSLVDYPGGAISTAETSFVSGFFGWSIELNGTAGSIAIGPVDHRIMLRRTGEDGWNEVPPLPAQPVPFDQFLTMVRGGPDEPGHLRSAVKLTQLAESAYRSAAEGRAVALPPLDLD
jgi:1,5-anhydro-D-fructose reductase (1,5-anhydro-D-mannitol-forming)